MMNDIRDSQYAQILSQEDIDAITCCSDKMRESLFESIQSMLGEKKTVTHKDMRIYIMSLAKVFYSMASAIEESSSAKVEVRLLISMMMNLMLESDLDLSKDSVRLYLPEERWNECFRKSPSPTLDESNT